MYLPSLWTRRRLVDLCVLAIVGASQAGAGILIANQVSSLIKSGPIVGQVWLAAVIIAAASALFGLRILQHWLAEKFALGYVTELRCEFVSHAMRLPLQGKSGKIGLLMTRIVNDLSAIRLWLARGLVAVLIGSTVFVTIAIYLVLTKPNLFPVLIPPFVLWLIILFSAAPSMTKAIVDSRRSRGRIASRAGAFLIARQTLLLHGRLTWGLHRISRLSLQLNKALCRRAAMSGLFQSASDLMLPTMVLGLALGLNGFGAPGTFTSSDIAFLVLISALIATQLNAMARALELGLAYRVAKNRFTGILAQPVVDPEHGTVALRREIKPVSFVVDGFELQSGSLPISLAISPGSKSQVLSGYPGLVRDLYFTATGLDKHASGTIDFNGRPIGDFKKRHVWRSIALISDTLPLLPGSIIDNVQLGAPSNQTEEAVTNLLTRFGLQPNEIVEFCGTDCLVQPEKAAAIRCARSFARRPGLLLIDDMVLLTNANLMQQVLSVLDEQALTVIIGTTESFPLLPGFEPIWISNGHAKAA